MASSILSMFFCAISVFSQLRFVSASTTTSQTLCCPSQSDLFLASLRSQCPLSISSSSLSPIEVDGDALDQVLSSGRGNAYTAVLFYSSSCPFSLGARSTFGKLSTLFPQIRHLAVEQSSAMPSVFSRYGIRSLPSILLVNQTVKVRYYGSRDISSLVQFYKKITGLVPVEFLSEDPSFSLGSSEKPLPQLLVVSSWKELLTKEPYLLFSIFFLFSRVLFYFCPVIFSQLKSIWFLYVPHMNLGIFGETSQLLGRIFHMIDVKRIWSEMVLCKARNFQNGAKNAQVWASSLASVSLGESSSARISIAGSS